MDPTTRPDCWDEEIVDAFLGAQTGASYETLWYGPYNMLLWELFPKHEKYIVSPQWGSTSAQQIDFTALYTVSFRSTPVFFMEIKPQHHLSTKYNRNNADMQVRSRFADFHKVWYLPKIHAVSALGKMLSFYEYTPSTEYTVPLLSTGGPAGTISDLAPITNWSYEVLTPAGEAKLRAVAADVKRMCAALGPNAF